MLGDKKFWNTFFRCFITMLIFFFLGCGSVWLICGFIESLIIGFAWWKIIVYVGTIFLIAILTFFIVRSEYRKEKREEYEKKLLNLTAKRDKQRVIFFDKNSSDEDRDFALANAKMYEKEINKAEKQLKKYRGKL